MNAVEWAMKQCPRCGGDLYDDGEGWTCFQCAWEDPSPAKILRERIDAFRASNRGPYRRRDHSPRDD